MIILDDNSPMPFGKHRGKRMVDVPARWLLWYDTTEPMGRNDAHHSMRAYDRGVRAYIADNMEILLSEREQALVGKRDFGFFNQ